MPKLNSKTNLILSAIILILVIACVGLLLTTIRGIMLANEVPFSNPSHLNRGQIPGIWRTSYMEWGREELIIQPDGKYKQIYFEHGRLVYSSTLNNWWIEPLEDGRYYLHLEDGKYFLDGYLSGKMEENPHIPKAEKYDKTLEKVDQELYDWIGDQWVNSKDQLILNIREDANGAIVLLHLWNTRDRGFPIIGGESEIFRRDTNNGGSYEE